MPKLLTGVWPILVTPFQEDGSLDLTSLQMLVEGTLAAGVNGVVAMGVNAEAARLSDTERTTIVGLVGEICRAASRPFLVTVSHTGTDVAVQRAREAAAVGAAGVMAAPPAFSRFGPAMLQHYAAISEIGLPVVVQDYPPETAVTLAPEQLVEILGVCDQAAGIKVEDAPTPGKIGRLRALLGPDVGLVGGLGAMYLLSELRRGGDGAMTGFPMHAAMLTICRAMAAGDEDTAEQTYRNWLPLMVLGAQAGVGLTVMKEVLKRRGLIRHAGLRRPGPALDDVARHELDSVLAAAGVDERNVDCRV
ncbi:MAG: dihydrodipicolinate synthase family protein [Chloroflexota bacterium]